MVTGAKIVSSFSLKRLNYCYNSIGLGIRDGKYI